MNIVAQEARENSARGTWGAAAPLALLVVVMTLAAIALRPDQINHDCAQYLQTGQMVLAGAVPLVDIYDTNPPLIMYLNAIPAGIAQVLGVPAIPVFSLCVLALVLWSAVVVYRLLRSSAALSSAQAGAVPVALLAVSLMLTCGNWMPWGDYGQREHLLVLLVTPFLVLRSLRWLGSVPAGRSAVTGAAVGFAAGVGLCLKPQFLLVIVLCEVYWVLIRRRVRPLLTGETVVATVAVALYVVWLRWLMPLPAREVFWGTLLPLVKQGYNSYNDSLSTLVAVWHPLWPIAAVGLAGLLMRPHRSEGPLQFVGPFSVASLASLALFVAQGKFWLYQLVPAFAWSAAVLALAYVDLQRRAEATGLEPATARPRVRVLGKSLPLVAALVPLIVMAALLAAGMLQIPGVRARLTWFCLLLVPAYLGLCSRPAVGAPWLSRLLPCASAAVAMILLGVWLGHAPPREPNPVEQAIGRHSRPGDRVLVLSTSVADPPYPMLLRLGRLQASRYLCAWPVPMFYQDAKSPPRGPFPYHRLETAPPAEQRFLTVLAEDLRRYRPPLVLILSSGPFQACPTGFNLLEYFRQSGFVASAMAGYAFRETVGDFAVFTSAGPVTAAPSAPTRD